MQKKNTVLRLAVSAIVAAAYAALTVGLGELGVLYLIGYTLLRQLPKSKALREFFAKVNQR